jgi:hypothetical protein
LQAISSFLEHRAAPGALLIEGDAGIGKTTLWLWEWSVPRDAGGTCSPPCRPRQRHDWRSRRSAISSVGWSTRCCPGFRLRRSMRSKWRCCWRMRAGAPQVSARSRSECWGRCEYLPKSAPPGRGRRRSVARPSIGGIALVHRPQVRRGSGGAAVGPTDGRDRWNTTRARPSLRGTAAAGQTVAAQPGCDAPPAAVTPRFDASPSGTAPGTHRVRGQSSLRHGDRAGRAREPGCASDERAASGAARRRRAPSGSLA